MGFFITTLNQGAGEILVDYYLPDNSPAHFVLAAWRSDLGCAATRTFGLEKSHAGYLGAELAKVETALDLKLD